MALSPETTSEDVEQLIYVKTNIGGYFFDAILRTEHTTSLTITNHPVETVHSTKDEAMTAVSDHCFVNPSVLVMEVGMSDVSKSIISGQFSGGWSRSVTAYKVLLELQKIRIPIQIVTRINVYKNMLIEIISVPDDIKTLHGLKATVTLREIFIATVKAVKVSARPQATDSTQKGEVQAIPSNESFLYQQGFGEGSN